MAGHNNYIQIKAHHRISICIDRKPSNDAVGHLCPGYHVQQHLNNICFAVCNCLDKIFCGHCVTLVDLLMILMILDMIKSIGREV